MAIWAACYQFSRAESVSIPYAWPAWPHISLDYAFSGICQHEFPPITKHQCKFWQMSYHSCPVFLCLIPKNGSVCPQVVGCDTIIATTKGKYVRVLSSYGINWSIRKYFLFDFQFLQIIQPDTVAAIHTQKVVRIQKRDFLDPLTFLKMIS